MYKIKSARVLSKNKIDTTAQKPHTFFQLVAVVSYHVGLIGGANALQNKARFDGGT